MRDTAVIHRSKKHEVSRKAAPPVDEERIRVRAYELFEKRNGGPGDAESDWYAAAAELETKRVK